MILLLKYHIVISGCVTRVFLSMNINTTPQSSIAEFLQHIKTFMIRYNGVQSMLDF